MRKVILAAIILLGICVAIYYYRNYQKVEITWSRENSLLKVPCSFDAVDIQSAPFKASLANSIAGLKRSSSDIQYGVDKYQRDSVVNSLTSLKNYLDTSPSKIEVLKYLYSSFTCYRSAAEKVLFTGYYIPTLQGSYVKSDRFRFPIYKKPKDLITVSLDSEIEKLLPKEFPVINRGRLTNGTVFIPYLNRDEIDNQNKLQDQNLEILWVDDDIDLFFMHIQGSGLVELPDGKKVYIGYADKNGNPYKAIGRAMIDRGLLTKETATMFGIKNKLRELPELKREIFSYNPSYVFFRTLETKPVGSLGVELTGGNSIATDTKLFPQGALAVVKMGDEKAKLVLNQDTGGAIRGAGRVDFFFGEGKEAENKASGHKAMGLLYFLAPSN